MYQIKKIALLITLSVHSFFLIGMNSENTPSEDRVMGAILGLKNLTCPPEILVTQIIPALLSGSDYTQREKQLIIAKYYAQAKELQNSTDAISTILNSCKLPYSEQIIITLAHKYRTQATSLIDRFYTHEKDPNKKKELEYQTATLINTYRELVVIKKKKAKHLRAC